MYLRELASGNPTLMASSWWKSYKVRRICFCLPIFCCRGHCRSEMLVFWTAWPTDSSCSMAHFPEECLTCTMSVRFDSMTSTQCKLIFNFFFQSNQLKMTYEHITVIGVSVSPRVSTDLGSSSCSSSCLVKQPNRGIDQCFTKLKQGTHAT